MSKKAKKALVPKLRFSEFRDAGEWEEKKLGKLSNILRGGSPRPIDDYLTPEPDGLNWLKIGDVDKESKYIVKTEVKVKKTALSKTREVEPGDLIMSNSMSFGRPYILKIKSCIHDGWIAVTEIINSINRDYLYYFILSNTSQMYFLNSAAGGGIKNLNADIIKLLSIRFPKFFEQQKIADCLSSIDDLITAHTQKLETLKAHKKGLLQQLFPAEGETVPKLRFSEFRDADDWEESQLGKVVEFLDGQRKPIKESDRASIRGQYPYYGASGIIDYVNGFIFDEDLILLGEDGENIVSRNLPLVFKVSGKCWVNNHAHVLKPRNPHHLNFLVQYLESLSYIKYNSGGAQPKLNQAVCKTIPLLLPKPNEQQKIADCLSSIDDLITAQAQKIESLKAHKKGLMQQLFPAPDEVIS